MYFKFMETMPLAIMIDFEPKCSIKLCFKYEIKL